MPSTVFCPCHEQKCPAFRSRQRLTSRGGVRERDPQGRDRAAIRSVFRPDFLRADGDPPAPAVAPGPCCRAVRAGEREETLEDARLGRTRECRGHDRARGWRCARTPLCRSTRPRSPAARSPARSVPGWSSETQQERVAVQRRRAVIGRENEPDTALMWRAATVPARCRKTLERREFGTRLQRAQPVRAAPGAELVDQRLQPFALRLHVGGEALALGCREIAFAQEFGGAANRGERGSSSRA